MNENTYANSTEEEEEGEEEEVEEEETEEESEEEVMVKQLVRHSRKFINVNTRYNIHLLLLLLFRKIINMQMTRMQITNMQILIL